MVKEIGLSNYFLQVYKNKKVEQPNDLIGCIAIPGKISNTQPQQENIQADCQFQSSRQVITDTDADLKDNLISAQVVPQTDDMPKSQFEKEEIAEIVERAVKLNPTFGYKDDPETMSFMLHKASLLNTPEEYLMQMYSTNTYERLFNGFCKWIYYVHKKVIKDVIKDVQKIMKNDPELFELIRNNYKNLYGVSNQLSQAQEIEGTKYQQDHSGQRAFLQSKNNYLIIPGTTLTQNRIDQNIFFNSKLLIQNIEESYQEAIIFNQLKINMSKDDNIRKDKRLDWQRNEDPVAKNRLKENKNIQQGGPVSNIERILNNLEYLNDQTIQKQNITINISVADGFQICTSKTLLLEYCKSINIDYESIINEVAESDGNKAKDEIFLREQMGCCVWFKGQLEGELDEGVWKFENVNIDDVIHNHQSTDEVSV